MRKGKSLSVWNFGDDSSVVRSPKFAYAILPKNSEGYYLVSNVSIGRWFHGSKVWIQPSIRTESTNLDSIEIQEYIKVMKETTTKDITSKYGDISRLLGYRFALFANHVLFSNIGISLWHAVQLSIQQDRNSHPWLQSFVKQERQKSR